MGEDPNRQIVAFMAFAVAFGLVGHHTRYPGSFSSKAGVGPGAGGDVKILLGGAIGTVLLVLLAQSGEGAASFAKGLAALTLVSSVLINGTEVFGVAGRLTGTTKLPSPTTKGTP